MEITVTTRHIRIAPRKLRLVSDLIRGEMVSSAMNTLKFTTKRGAKIMYKTLMSAVANASNKGTMDVESLYVKKVSVDEGSTMKRHMPRAQGRATIIRKRMSHINIVLDEK